MVSVCIKYSFMFWSSSYLFQKLLNIKLSPKQNIMHLWILFILSVFHSFSYEYTPSLSLLFTISIFCMLEWKFFYQSWNVTVVTAILSFGFSYFAFWVATFATSSFGFSLISIFCKEKYWQKILSFLIIGSFQILLCTIPFFFKRLKKGMPFLYQQASSEVGVFISISLVMTASLFYILQENNLYFIIPLFYVAISGLILFFWWKSRLTKTYVEKLKSNEVASLQTEIEKLQEQNKALKQNNDSLAKIIHKDNKLIPAMELAVRELLQLSKTGNVDELREKGDSLSQQLHHLVKERQGIMNFYQNKESKLPSTGVGAIDTILQYMAQKSISEQNEFQVILNGSIKYMAEHTIRAEDLSTLLADLIENARIANRGQPQKNILLNIGVNGQHYYIDVFDSGIPFQAESLLHFGKSRFTTHADEGGSGIGLMTLYEILQKYHASFLLDETVQNDHYFKKVSVYFDDRQECRVKSQREEIWEKCAVRDDILLSS